MQEEFYIILGGCLLVIFGFALLVYTTEQRVAILSIAMAWVFVLMMRKE